MGYLATKLAADLAVNVAADLRAPVSRLLYALSDFSAANYYATLVGGGEQGDPAGFGVSVLCRLDTIIAAYRCILRRYTGGAGYFLDVLANNGVIQFGALQDDGFLRTATYTLTAADASRLLLLTGRRNESAQIQLYVGRDLVSSSTPMVGLRIPADKTTIGIDAALTVPLLQAGILAALTWRGVPSTAQIAAFADAVRALGDMPTTMEGATVTHHWSAKRALRGAYAVSGQVAPAELADSITSAAVDAMARVGSPTVRVIDPSIDGRKAYGAQGFSAASYLQCAPNTGLAGAATGFSWAAVMTFYAGSGGQRVYLGRRGGTPSGWGCEAVGPSNSPLYWRICDGPSSWVLSSSYTVPTGDLGQQKLVTGVFTGSAIRLLVDGVQAGPDVSASNFIPSAEGFSIGLRATAEPAHAVSQFAGGHFVWTLAEIQQMQATFAATGKLVPPAGKADNAYDLTADIIANGGPSQGVPAQVLDRIGTDHLTRVNAAIATHGNAVGLTGFTTAAHRLVRSGSGVGAVSAQSFWALLVLRIDAQAGIASRFRTPYSKYTPPAPTRSGWDFTTTTTNMAMYFEAMGASVAAAGPYALSAGSTYVFHGLVDLAAGKVQLYANGAFALEGSISGFTASAALECVGVDASSAYISDGQTIYIVGGGGASLPTPAEMAAQSAEFFATGTITPIAGKQARHTVLKTDIAEAGGDVPRSAKDRVEPSDTFQVQGFTRLEPAQRVERVWSYERTPILYGAESFTETDFAEGAAIEVASGIPFWIGAAISITSQAVSGGVREFLSNFDGLTLGGCTFRTIGFNGSLDAVVVNAAGSVVITGALSITAADVGKSLLVYLVHSGSSIRLYAKRAAVGNEITCAGYRGTTAPLRMGKSATLGGRAATGIRVDGFAWGRAAVSLAEIQAAHDAFLADEDMPEIPGKTEHLVSLKRDALANGGAMPAVFLDRIGAAHMTRVGAPTIAPIYARAAGW